MTRISRNRIWGFGLYINTAHYRYVAVQFGPWWIYLWSELPPGWGRR